MTTRQLITTVNFYEFIELMNAQRKKERDSLITQVATVPIPDAVVDRISRLGHDDLREVLRNHPGDSVERKYQSVRTMHSIFEQAHGDLLAQLDRFHERSIEPGYRKRSERHIDEGIRATVCKEIMAFSSAAASLEELERSLKEAVGLSGYTKKVGEVFDPLEHEFVTELRNAMAHYLAPEAFAMIRWDAGRGRSTDFFLDTWELETYNNFNDRAARYLKNAGRHIFIRPLITAYSKRVNEFVKWLLNEVDAAPPDCVAEYRRCRNANRANGARVGYKLVLQTAIDSRVDPYTSLDRYLTSEQVKEALELPSRSPEQVDFIIGCVDEFGACDDEIRALAYRLFGVEADKAGR